MISLKLNLSVISKYLPRKQQVVVLATILDGKALQHGGHCQSAKTSLHCMILLLNLGCPTILTRHVMERSWKVMEFEICIPGLEKSWKLEKLIAWVTERSWNFIFL